MKITRKDGYVAVEGGVTDLIDFVRIKHDVTDISVATPYKYLWVCMDFDYSMDWHRGDMSAFKVKLVAYDRERRFIFKMDKELAKQVEFKNSDVPCDIQSKLITRLRWLKDQILPELEKMKKEKVDDFTIKCNAFEDLT